MTKNTLVRLGNDVQLDIDKLIAGRMLIQANSGGGKSYTVRKIAEVTYGHVQQIILDVDGEYHTLREDYDYILFGKDGDYPADLRGAALLARRLLETGVSAIIDLYELGLQKAEFIRRFLESLVSAPRELWHPVLVFVDEAHTYAPETGKSVAREAVESLMTLGRKRGFTGILATQRISKLSKNAAAECNNKLIGRSSLDIDMKRSADEIGLTSREDMRGLRELREGWFHAIGSAFVVGKTIVDNNLIKIGKVKSTHLSAGQTRATKPVAPSAKIKKVFSQFADLPQEAVEEQRSVTELKAQVKQLVADLEAAKKAQPKIVEAKPPKTIEKSILSASDRKLLEKLVENSTKLVDKATGLHTTITKRVGNEPASAALPIRTIAPPVSRVVGPTPERPIDKKLRLTEEQLAANMRIIRAGGEPIKGGPAAILSTLIQHSANGCTSQQIAVITGYKTTSRYEYLRQLKTLGYVLESGDRYFATPEGKKAMPNVEPLPKGDKLRELALSRVKAGERKILDVLINAYPEEVSHDDMLAATGFQNTSRYEYTRQLVARELATTTKSGARATDNLFS